jgi:hypothetical protein
MAQGEVYYVIEFRNPTVDDHVHYLTMGFTPDPKRSLEDHLRILLTGRPQIQVDIEKAKASKPFNNKIEADAEGARLGQVASEANPDRIDATAQFPDAPNLALEVGNNVEQPALTPVAPKA